MSIAGDICRGIRDYISYQNRQKARGATGDPVGFRPVQATRFFEQAKRVKEGYVVDGVACAVAEFFDGSVAAYFGPTVPARVLQRYEKESAVAFLDATDRGEVPAGGVHLNW